MSENILNNIITKKIERIDLLKKTTNLDSLDKIIDKNNSYIDFKKKNSKQYNSRQNFNNS